MPPGSQRRRWPRGRALAATNASNQNVASITQLSNVSVSGNSLTVNVPQQSVTLFVIPPASGAPAAPTGLSAAPGNVSVYRAKV